MARAVLGAVAELDVRPILPSVHVPVTVINRRGDLVVSVEAGRWMASQMPEARFVELDGEDHLFCAGDIHSILDEVEEVATGARGGGEPNRVLATVLFTDIVDSTKTASTLGDRRWREVLARHDALIRRELGRYRGLEVKATGDGFLATFDGPARAIKCARSITEEIRALGIEARAGLHTGEVEIVGSDVAGIAVHIGARVGAEAEAGEVLVSSTVKDLVVGSGLDFEDRGARELKGVPGEWRLFSVQA
jgi:class 3 adenylate cyclase